MFKKLREKITEEVQQTSLRLPVSVQQSVQQLSQLSPFSNAAIPQEADVKADLNNSQIKDELLVDISDIKPAGDNKSLFSIDEDSHEDSPSKSGFQLVNLDDGTGNNDGNDNSSPTNSEDTLMQDQGVEGVTYDPTSPHQSSYITSPKSRRDSTGSSVSDVSGLFPIYEVPTVPFTVPQSDMESSSEWEDGSVDKISKDTVYQAYVKMRQRYHKYKGRYTDITRVLKEKEKETDRLREVLTKTQDKAMRRMSELREQCSLEQQAKAHLEETLRLDVEEKDHKIDALLTKISLLQEGYGTDVNKLSINQATPSTTSADSEIKSEDSGACLGFRPGQDECDNVSVTSLGSISTLSTLATNTLETEELIEKLRGDVAKHKSLLSRCMENIRTNKDRIATLTQERDLATAQLQEKIRYIDLLQDDHNKELESLRASVNSSALSMAETKKQLFDELQAKESEAENFKKKAELLQSLLDQAKLELKQKNKIQSNEFSNEDDEIYQENANEMLGPNTVPNLLLDLSNKNETDNKCSDSETTIINNNSKLSDNLLTGSGKDLENQVLEIKKQNDELSAQLKSFKDTNSQLECRCTEYFQQISILQNDKTLLEQKLSEIRSDGELEQNQLESNYKKEISSLQQKLKEITEKYEAVKKEKQQQAAISNENIDHIAGKLKLSKKNLEETTAKLIIRNEEIELLKKQITSLNNSNKEDQQHKKNTEDMFIQLSKENEESKKLCQDLESKLKLEKESMSKLSEESKNLTSKINELSAKNEDLVSQNKSHILRNSEAATEIENLKQKEVELIEENENLKSKYDSIFAKNKKLTNEIEILITKSEKLLSENENLTSELESLSTDSKTLTLEIEGLRSQNKSLLSENDCLKSEKDTLNQEIKILQGKSSEENGRAFDELNKLREKMDNLNCNLVSEIKEKDKINEDLNNKILELNDKLTEKSGEYTEKTNNILKEYNDKIQNKENEVQNLMKVVEERENEIKEVKQNQIGQKEEFESNLNKVKAESNEMCKTKDGEIQSLRTTLKKFESNLKRKEDQFTNVQKTIIEESKEVKKNYSILQQQSEELKNTNKSLKDEFDKLQIKNETLQQELKEQINNAESDSEKMKSENNLLNEKIKEMENANLTLQEQLKDFENKSSIIKENLEQMESKNAKLTENLKEFETSNSLLKEKIKSFQNEDSEAKELKSKNLSLQEQVDNLLVKNQNLEEDLTKMQSKNTSLVEESEKFNSSHISLEKEYNSLKEEKSKVHEEVKCLNNTISDLKNNLQIINVKKDACECELKKLKENYSVLEAANSQKDSELAAFHKNKEDLMLQIENEKTNSSKLSEEISRLAVELQKSNELYQRTSSDNTSYDDRIKTLENLIALKDKQIEVLKQEKTALEQKYNDINSEKDTVISESKKLYDDVDILKRLNDELEIKLKEVHKQKEKVVSEQEMKINQIDELQNTIDKHISELEKNKEIIENYDKKYKDLETNLSESKGKFSFSLEDLEKTISDLQIKLENSQSEVNKLKSERDELKKSFNSEEDIRITYQQKLDEKDKEIEILKDEFKSNCTKKEKQLEHKLRCDIENVQRNYEEKLAKCIEEGMEKHQSELTSVGENYRLSLAERDATIAQLKDNIDQTNLEMEDQQNQLNSQIKDLQSELAQSQLKLQNEVNNMEISNEDLQQKIKRLTEENKKLEEKLSSGTSEIEEQMKEQQEQMEMQFNLMRNQLEQKYTSQTSYLQDEVKGLTEIKDGFEKQISQIEENNSQMHLKIAGIQDERNNAEQKLKVLQGECELIQIEKKELLNSQNNLTKQIDDLKLEKNNLDQQLKIELSNSLKLKEDNETVNKKILHLENEIKILKSELEHKVKDMKLVQNSTDSIECSSPVHKNQNVSNNQLDNKSTSLDNEIVKLKEELKNTKAHFEKVKSELRIREEEIIVVRNNLREVQDKLHLETALSGSNDSTNRIKELEEQLISEKESHQKQIKDLMSDYETQIMSKQLECNVSMVSALEQQDNETNAIVRQQRDTLRSCQQEVKEKTEALQSLKIHSEAILKYEDQLASLRTQHQSQLRNVESLWKSRIEDLVKKKELDMKSELDILQQQWNSERSELEKLTQVAAAAFRSGTDSVELLKKQVTSQRKELEEVKKNHRKEMQEMQALLELKRRRRRPTPPSNCGGMNLGVALEEAAEFEYLRNILYQYMMGKETLTLAKVLCAVVKFDSKQQIEILEQEERKQNMLREADNDTIKNNIGMAEQTELVKIL